jgi:hypothetical protein
MKTALPPGITAADLKFPSYEDRADRLDDQGDHGQLTFYNTTGFGWCIATLLINRASSRSRHQSARTYAVRVSDGAGVRIGTGPHVLNTVTVYLRKSRLAVLQKYIDLYQKGAIQANTTRDRISSRRAEGIQKRAAGYHSWSWDV